MTTSKTILGVDGNHITVSETDDRSAIVVAIQQNDDRGRVATVRLDEKQFHDLCSTKYHLEVEAEVPAPPPAPAMPERKEVEAA